MHEMSTDLAKSTMEQNILGFYVTIFHGIGSIF